jgi:phosphatidylglycerophosphate synthase
MLDRTAARLIAPTLSLIARGLRKVAVTADQVTLAGFCVGLLALPALATRHFWLALFVIFCSRLADGLDGALARLTQPTDRGGFLDISLDFIFYASVPFGFALADPARNALPAAALLFAFMGTATSFLAYATLAAKRGLRSTQHPNKAFFYLGGLTEATETLALFVLCCLKPQWFPVLAWSFAGLCTITTLTRLATGWVNLSDAGIPPEE